MVLFQIMKNVTLFYQIKKIDERINKEKVMKKNFFEK